MRDIVWRIAEGGGSIAIDILGPDELKSAEAAEKAGLLKWQSGSWGDSDYYLLTDKGRGFLDSTQDNQTQFCPD